MKNILLVFTILISNFVLHSQCAFTLISQNNVCQDQCAGEVQFKLEGVTPLTFYSATDTVPLFLPNATEFFVGHGSLCVGSHLFSMTDGNGCEIDTVITIVQFPPFEAELIVSIPNTSSVACDAEFTAISKIGGISPITFSAVYECGTSNVVQSNNVCPGSYYSYARDSAGCTFQTSCTSTEFLSTEQNISEVIEIQIQENFLQINQPYDNLKMYNLAGQMVMESDVPEQLLLIEQLAAGPYIISVLKDGALHNEKVMKTSP